MLTLRSNVESYHKIHIRMTSQEWLEGREENTSDDLEPMDKLTHEPSNMPDDQYKREPRTTRKPTGAPISGQDYRDFIREQNAIHTAILRKKGVNYGEHEQ